MKRKILSLCLVLSMSAGLLPAVSSAENADDIITQEESEAPSYDMFVDFSDTDAEIDFEIQDEENEEALLYADTADNVTLYDGSAVMPTEEYDAQLAAKAVEIGSTDAAVLVENEEYVNILLRRRLVEKAGYNTLASRMLEDADFAASMEWLFSDVQMLRYYSYGGEPEANGKGERYKVANSATYMSSFDVLSQIYTKHKEDMNDEENAPLYKRMMAAIALTHSVRIYNWQHLTPYGRRYKWYHYSEPVRRYEIYKKFYGFGFLANEFVNYNVEEMRMVMFCPIDNDQLEWLQWYYRVKYLKNADYATRVVPTYDSNVGGWLGLAYGTKDKDAVSEGSRPLYMPENYDYWNSRYGLELHDDYFDFKVDYGLNEKGEYYEQQWITIARGGVCVETSFTGSVLRNAFGLAARYMQEGSNHMSYISYRRSGGRPWIGNEYPVYGMPAGGFMTYGYTHVPAGWSNYKFTGLINAGYMFLGIDAIYSNHGTNYEKAENLAWLAGIEKAKGNYEEALALYDKALEEQYFHFESYVEIASIYEILGKTNEDYMELAARFAEDFKYYPHTLYDFIMNYLYKKLTTELERYQMVSIAYKALTAGMGATAANSGLIQPAYCVQIASTYRNKLPKVAAFSFDSGLIAIGTPFQNIGRDFLYSFDKGETWNTHTYEAGAASFKLTPEEIAQITDANDIYYKFDGTDYVYVIAIGTQARPVSNNTTNRVNDDEDRFYYVQNGLEYSTDQGATWATLTTNILFEGDVTVWIRKKTAGVLLVGPYLELHFTKATDTPERRYLKLSNNIKLISYPLAIGGYPAAYATDTNNDTFWKKQYMQTGLSNGNPAWGDEFVFEIGEPHYISAIGYIPVLSEKTAAEADGTIKKCEVYTSNDKVNWNLAGRTDTWTNVKTATDTYPREQFIDFDKPAYAKYIKLKIIEAGTWNVFNAVRGYATAAEFKLYENETCPNKDVEELSLTTNKTSYKIGDKVDFDSITAELRYTDGTSSFISADALEFDVNVFDSTEINEVNASFKGAKASFPVTVAENDRVATGYISATAASRKYYAEDNFANEDVLVKVKNSTEQWYLLPDEFEITNPTLAAGPNTLNITHNGLKGSFPVTAEKAAKELRIDTDENFKTQYFIGDAMDLSGMSVSLVYTDGTEKALDSSEYDLTLTKDGDTPITSDIFARTAGTKTIKATLKNKEEVSGELDVTVFTYITSGDFSFEALDGETSCKLTGYTPSGDISDTTVNIPETVTVGGYTYTVSEIGEGAFRQAEQLHAVSIPKSVNKIERGAFSACSKLVNVYMTDYTSFDGFVCEDEAFAEVQDGYVYVKQELSGITSPIPGYQVTDILSSARGLLITPPAKTQYILGEEFDKTGMKVSIVLHDGSYVETTAYTMRGFYSTVTGELTLTVTLNENPRISGTFKVNVGFPPITIKKQPVGATYAAGDTIAPISVEASVPDGLPLMYKWYRSEANDKNGTLIENAVKAEYEPTEAGYYYAAVYTADKNNNESEPVYSDTVNIMVGDYTAIVGNTGYDSLSQAIADAPDGSTIRVCKDIEINANISVSGKKLTLDGQGHMLKRASSHKYSFMSISDKSVLTLKNVIFDGGAVWTGAEDPVLKRGLTNSGLWATCPFILANPGTHLIVSDGAVLQNNDGRGSVLTVTNSTGGAIYGNDSTITIDGGKITNNAASTFGSAIYLRGNSTASFIANKGEVSYNHDYNATQNSYGSSTICLENNAVGTITGGTYKNNKSNTCGAVFGVGNGKLDISGGTFENNYAGQHGAVAFVYQKSTLGTISVANATFRNNYARQDGGVFYCYKKATIKNSVFENNTAGQNGGVVYMQSAAIESNGNVYRGNKAKNDGGTVYTANVFNTVLDTFENNTAARGGTVCTTGTAAQLMIGDMSCELRDVYMPSFKYVYIASMKEGKLLMIDTPTEITSDTVVASSQYASPMDIRINGYKTLLDGKTYSKQHLGYLFKPVITPRVTYNKNGGVIDNEVQYTVYNEGVGLTLPSAHKDGYIFDGWFDNADLTGEPVTEIGTEENTDKAFWAKWSIAEYSVTLNPNGGILESALEKYTYGEGASLPVVTKDGYNFVGWFDNAELNGTPVTEITAEDFGNKEYWAKWAENEYSVTLNLNGGTLESALEKYTYGEGAVLPVPTRTDYTFAGWFDNAELTGAAITEIGAEDMGNKEYWAKWTINKHSVSFINHDGKLLQQLEVEIGKLPEYTGKTPVKDRDARYTYTFAGWDPEIVPVSGNAEYTAKYTSAPRVYSLMLNLNIGILDNEEEYTQYTYGEGIVLPTPYRDDYIFEGWYDNKDFNGEAVTEVDAEATGNKAFYAKWSYIMPTEFTILFINFDNSTLWSGTFPVGTIPVYGGATPSRPTKGKYSYEFIGWDKEFAEVTEAASYVAQFKRIPVKYFIEYTDENNILAACPEMGEYDLILAAYDSYGRLKSIESTHLVFHDAGEQTVVPQTLNMDGAAKVKAMLWDSLNNMTPKCEAVLRPQLTRDYTR